MATRRMIPTGFFRDPDIMDLPHETQFILIGLTLHADDEGRGVAHAPLLGREMNFPEETMERALQELATAELVTLYQVGKHRYYSVTKWWDWQTIHPSRRIASKYPAPPLSEDEQTSADSPQTESSNLSASCMQSADSPQTESSNLSAQYKLSKYKVSKEKEGEEEPHEPETQAAHPNVIPFPTTPSGGDSDGVHDVVEDQAATRARTSEIATILKLPITEALTRVVQEFGKDPTLSLLGEADAAREWINDRKHNQKQQTMSPAFFRRWLKRERGDYAPPARAEPQTGTAPTKPAPPSYKSLMGLGKEMEREMRESNEKGKREHGT
jgi:hypothetical protein